MGEVSQIIYESETDSRSKEKTAVDTANKQTSSDTIFSTGVTAVISVACSLLARTYVVNPAITLLHCASFSFVTTVAFFVQAKMYKPLAGTLTERGREVGVHVDVLATEYAHPVAVHLGLRSSCTGPFSGSAL